MTDIEELICAMQKEIKEIKEKYSYSDSEVTAYLQGQRDMVVDLAEILPKMKGNDANEQT